MKKALVILALPLIQFAAVQAFAAEALSGTAKSRADVKEETKVAAKSGEMKNAEAGQAMAADSKAPVGTKTRKDVKDDTRAAAKAGALPKAGEAAATQEVDKKSPGTKTRSEVKADAKAGAKPAKMPEESAPTGK
jgi:poly-gamma-glutamate capsule biosynthesis protein CapA/YwtB (metallophosphatase superfamily)